MTMAASGRGTPRPAWSHEGSQEGATVHDAGSEPGPTAERALVASAPTESTRLHRLLDACRSIVSDLSLSSVLGRVVEAAQDVSNARYAALGVIGPDGRTLEQFLHVGLDGRSVRAIGRLPEGRGLLGALVADPRPFRLAQIAQYPRAA